MRRLATTPWLVSIPLAILQIGTASAADLMIEQISGAGLTGRFSDATLSVRAKGDGS